MTRRLTALSLLIAALLGSAAALWAWPQWQWHQALRGITAVEPPQRERAWNWLLAPDRAGRERVLGALDRVNRALEGAGDEALLDAGARLRRLDRWGWDHQPHELVLRELAWRADGDADDQMLAAMEMAHCPLDAPERSAMDVFGRLLKSESPGARRRSLESACAWLGRDRIAMLAEIMPPADDGRLIRMSLLALSWADQPVQPPPHSCTSAACVEAEQLRAVAADPDDAGPVLRAMEQWADAAEDPRPAFEAILRRSRDPRAEQTLQRLAEEGSDAARFALHARDPATEAEAARRVLGDASQQTWRRRLAAWRLLDDNDGVETDTVLSLLEESVTESDGSVYAAALLAERRLPQDRAAALAESWIRDFDDDRKRAGALLAALLGTHESLLREALDASPDPAVRTAIRLALYARGVEVGPEPAREFAHRALGRENGDFNPDAALCALRAGDADVLALLAERPPAQADLRAAVQQRVMLIERFAPHWLGEIGRPAGGDARGLLLHLDRLRARWLLESRRLKFDPADARFSVREPR